MCWGLGGSQTAARVGVLLLEQRQRPGREGGRFLPGNRRVTHWEHNPLGPESAVGPCVPRRWPRAGARLALSHRCDPAGAPGRMLVQEDVGESSHCHQLWCSASAGEFCPAQLWRCNVPYFSGDANSPEELVWRGGLVLSGGRTWPSGILFLQSIGMGGAWLGSSESLTAELSQGCRAMVILHPWQWCRCSRFPALHQPMCHLGI